ncbi:MAG TPA: AMP-binding protein [Baekduia sp.]|jgi:crotonobetaine/carnitine-CoA ligase
MLVTGETARELWRARVADTPAAPFVVEGGRTLSFAEADGAMLRIAGALRAAGVEAGTRVLVGLPNATRTVLVHAALRELGAVIVPLLPGLRLPELTFQIEHSQATVLVAGDPIASILAPALDEFPGLTRLALEDLDGHAPIAPGAELPGHGPDSPWAILYTSGSTGRPKGVVLPSGAFVNGGACYADRFAIGSDDNLLVATPIAHAVGALTLPSMALRAGCRMTVVDRFSPSRFWDDVAAGGATATILFPAQLNLLLQLDGGPAAGASTLRLVITHAWVAPFRERFGVELGLCWGMTETGAAGTGTPVGYHGSGDGCVGTAMRGVQLSIRDDAGRPVPAGTEGALCIRNDHQMLGYLDDAAATASTIVDGWLHSGDRAVLDEQGRLFYRGRLKNMIKRSGENISPEEVEAVLDAHDGVEESLVLGVADALRTEEVVAVVASRAGARVDAEALAAHVGAQLARWKAPRYIRVSPEPLPRLANGKIDRLGVLAALDLDACWDARATSGEAAR